MNMNSQEKMSPPEPNNPVIEGPEKCSIAKAQDRGFKIAIINIFKDLKDKRNKSFD